MKWVILCLDGSFLKAPLNLLERADGGAGPSADLRIRSSGTDRESHIPIVTDGPAHEGTPV